MRIDLKLYRINNVNIAMNIENVIPLYGRGGNEEHPEDPRKKPRARPKGERPPVQNRRNWFGWGNDSDDGNQVQFHFGAGFPFFPFVYAGYNTGPEIGGRMGVRPTAAENSSQAASRFFLILAAILLWVLLTN
ncbi:RING finger protein, putative [Perkinsus marinus ATCC 50983]|uniref:RING finger protein, putative n=1 Tax=Perkinsus marinus (strain ATCC 50983 / TXsc) TaxID=423536 RepID=C5KAJ4_PERM5|nr:RING finger protein, putative [Perkinsus marinus ATCC 50983]EER18530.1 RING finger protein, putative [Perkinsus marinus ATCC 50983]|eukprot:XP_002786734.1 RING finger protein, putative [Perkinsus marinus ATCC 50983]